MCPCCFENISSRKCGIEAKCVSQIRGIVLVATLMDLGGCRDRAPGVLLFALGLLPRGLALLVIWCHSKLLKTTLCRTFVWSLSSDDFRTYANCAVSLERTQRAPIHITYIYLSSPLLFLPSPPNFP